MQCALTIWTVHFPLKIQHVKNLHNVAPVLSFSTSKKAQTIYVDSAALRFFGIYSIICLYETLFNTVLHYGMTLRGHLYSIDLFNTV